MWAFEHPDTPPPVCTVCRAPLAGDPDDDPWHPMGAVCGDCARSRTDDELIWALDTRAPDEAVW